MKDTFKKFLEFVRKNKWLCAFIATAVALVAAIIVAIVIGVSSGSEPPAPEYTEGNEVGVYYHDVADGEILLTLSGGNKFTLTGPNVNKTGTYTVDADGKITLDYIKDEDGTTTATVDGNNIQLLYGGADLSFTKKVEYTVSFDTADGSNVPAIKVINGKTANKPADPAKEGYAFVGWYSDAAFTTPYDFSSATVTVDTVLYAKFVEDQVGGGRFTIDFDLGYEDAPVYENITTVSGLAYNVPTPANREGYTFGGWWISMYEDAEKLSYKYTENTVFYSNTTLYAVWNEEGSAKLASPMASINGNNISWDNVGASTYTVVITDASGAQVYETTVATTTATYDFAGSAAGDYVVTVTAIANNPENNSAPTSSYYANKALAKVSQFLVIDGIIIYNAVEGAEKYYVSIDCGNDAHNHTLFNNGASTSYSIMNCPMQEGGIEITVTAEADGYASSVSETFVYERSLDSIGTIVYNATTDTFTWNAVANARYYTVTVMAGGKTYTFNNGTKTTFNAGAYTGEISVSVTPVNAGFNSPAATTATVTKTAPATPSGLTVSGMIVTWDAAEGATEYEIKVGDLPARKVTTNSFDLTTLATDSLVIGSEYNVIVKSVNGAESSAYTDPVKIGYRKMNQNLVYSNKTLYWTPVIGVSNYQVRINGDSNTVFTVTGANKTAVTLTKAGVNTLEVRFTDFGGSDWVSVEVVAYAVKYMPRNEESELVEYLAAGDTMTLPSSYSYTGYNFTGWYTSPSGAAGNGKTYAAGTVFADQDSIVLYADWDPIVYNITIQTEGYDITNIAHEEKYPAKYTKKYTLPVPVSGNPTLTSFAGWFTGPAGTGSQLTDAEGNSLTAYNWTRDQIAYPFYDTGVLTFSLKGDNTYAVSRGPNIDTVKNVTVPTYYNGLPVTTIVENAFASRTKLETVSIPDTIKLVGAGAFSGCTALTAINVYEVEGNHEKFYASDDGALIRYDMGTTYLEVFPRAKTGTYVMSDEIQIIRNKAFNYADINKVVIGKGVTTVSKYGFYYCYDLETVEFAEGRTNSITLENYAWIGCSGVKSIKLPATLNMEAADLTLVLGRFKSLQTIEVEEGNQSYSTVDGMLTNAAKNTIIYCPAIREGSFTVPQGIQEIGANAFSGRSGITSIVIPAYVKNIGDGAFNNCSNVTSITFEGSRRNDLTIGSSAFAGLQSLKSVTFKGNEEGTLETGAITIGAKAFAPFYPVKSIVDPTPTGEIVTALKTLTFEDGVNIALIGAHAFEDQINLYSVSYGENARIAKIGDYAFANNSVLEKVNIPPTTTEIGSYAYAGCSNVSEVALVEGAGEITFGAYAFKDCEKLVTIYLPSTVRNFDGSAFDGCNNIKKIEVAPGNQHLKSDESGILYQLEDGVEKTLLFYPKAIVNQNGGIVNNIISTVEAISGAVFANNNYLTEVHIGKNVTAIGDKAFAECPNLTKVVFEEGGTALELGAYAFSTCTSLVYGTAEDTDFVLPAYTTKIGDYAFERCTFTEFTLPESVTHIGVGAFYYNRSLTAITIPLKVSGIGNKAFSYCTSLKSFTIDRPDTENGETANNIVLGYIGVGENKDGVFYGSSKLDTVDLGDRVVSIGDYAFYGISSLKSITLSDNLNYIGSYAFYNTRLVAVEIPNTVEKIDTYAFAVSSSSYAKITASALTFELGGTAPLEIGENAFGNQKLVTTITLPARTAVIYEESVPYGTISYKNISTRFTGMSSLAAINVEPAPAGTVAKFASVDGVLYETDENGNIVTLLYCPVANTGVNGTLEIIVPKSVRTVERGAFYNTTKLKTITFEEYETTDEEYGQPLLSLGVGAYSYSAGMSYSVIGGDTISNTNTITKISLPSHLAYLGNRAISLTKDPITLTFNPDATSIELANYAFYYCSATEINLPNISKMGVGVFSYCENARSITFTVTGEFDSLPNSTFSYCTSLESYTVPKEVVMIGNSAFSTCESLKTITFEEGSLCESIGDWAFSKCYSLESINIGACEKLNYLGPVGGYGLVFQNCEALDSIDLSECVNLSYIGNSTFSGCTALKSFAFPENIQSVGYDIFKNCSSLEKVTLSKTFSPQMFIPSSGTTLKTNFFGCTNLKEVVVPGDNLYFTTDEYGAIYDKQKTIVYFFPPAADATGYTIPATVKEIAPYAFAFYSGSSIVLPEGLETIGNFAFYYNDFETVTVPASVKTIGGNVFGVCGSLQDANGNYYYATHDSKLHTVTFAEGSKLESIGYGAFYYCDKLESINLPDSVATIGNYAFYHCESLKEIVVPAAVKVIANGTSSTYPFAYCYNLEKITLQEGLETIGYYAFYYAGRDSETDMEISIPSTVTTIGTSAFDYVTNMTSVTFPEDSALDSIGAYAFRGTNLESVVLPPMLTTIAGTAFLNSKTITSFEFTGSSLTELPAQFFKGFTALENVILPEGLVSIGERAFSAPPDSGDRLGMLLGETYEPCTALKSITIPASVTSIGNSAFENCTALETVVFAPGSSITAIGSDPNAEASVFKNTPSLKTVVLPDTVEVIGGHAFEESGVAQINLPASLTTIGDYAFSNCDNLTQVDLFANISYLGSYAFYDCDSLVKATPSFGLEYIGALAFAYCEKLTEAYIPATVTEIVGNPYVGCSSVSAFQLDPDNSFYLMAGGALYDLEMTTLIYYPASITDKEVVLPDSVNEIASGAFAGAAMEKITLPAKLSKVYANTFRGCPNLTTVVLESGLKEIEPYAFEGCAKLDNVHIPATIKTIGEYAFANCASLNNVTFGETIADEPYILYPHIFDGCTGMTQVTMPSNWKITDADYKDCTGSKPGKNTDLTCMFPSYMFANTGIVNLVIPKSVTDLVTTGVFMDCKALETVEFESPKLSNTVIGNYYFAGCTSLKEYNQAPSTSSNSPFSNTKGFSFAGCTSLEKFTAYYTKEDLFAFLGASPTNHFEGCTGLKEVDCYQIIVVENTEEDFKYEIVAPFFNYQQPSMFKDCGFTEFYFGEKGTVSKYMFDGCTELTEISLMPAYLNEGAFRGCTGVKNAYLYPYVDIGTDWRGNPVEVFSRFYPNIFEGWTSEQNIYVMTMTRDEFITLLAKNTSTTAPTIDDVFAGCEANIYFKEDILAMQTITVGTANSLMTDGFFAGTTADQTIKFTRQSYTELYEYIQAGMFTDCAAKVYDKDGNLLTYNASTKAVTVTNAQGEAIAVYYYGAADAEAFAALALSSMSKLEFVYLANLGFGDIATLQGDATEFAALKGCSAVFYDKDGVELTFDTTTGLLKTVTVYPSYYVISGGGLVIGGAGTVIGSTLNKMDFTMLKSTVTLYIKNGQTYDDVVSLGSDANDNFKGCAATVYDSEGNKLVFAASGTLIEVYAPDGDETPIYTAPDTENPDTGTGSGSGTGGGIGGGAIGGGGFFPAFP